MVALNNEMYKKPQNPETLMWMAIVFLKMSKARFYLAELRVCYGAILAHPQLQTWLEEFEQNEWLAKSDVLNALSNDTPALDFRTRSHQYVGTPSVFFTSCCHRWKDASVTRSK